MGVAGSSSLHGKLRLTQKGPPRLYRSGPILRINQTYQVTSLPAEASEGSAVEGVISGML